MMTIMSGFMGSSTGGTWGAGVVVVVSRGATAVAAAAPAATGFGAYLKDSLSAGRDAFTIGGRSHMSGGVTRTKADDVETRIKEPLGPKTADEQQRAQRSVWTSNQFDGTGNSCSVLDHVRVDLTSGARNSRASKSDHQTSCWQKQPTRG